MTVSIGACQVDSSTTSQEVVDCTPGGNYCSVGEPATPYWDGKPPPAAGDGQLFVVYADWKAPGEYIGALADYRARKIPWAARVQKAMLAGFIATLSDAGTLDYNRPSPVPPSPGQGGRYILELALRASLLPAQAMAASQQCK